MWVISYKSLREFWKKYPDAEAPLRHWYAVMKRKDFESLHEVRILFPHADKVGKLTVFNVSGNKYRLAVAIHYNTKRIYIRAVLTHDEYDRGRWKE